MLNYDVSELDTFRYKVFLSKTIFQNITTMMMIITQY